MANDIASQIKEKADIVDVISSFGGVKPEKAGSDYKCLCPFHNDNSPSFMISPSKKIARCFVCDITVDVISFVMRIKNVEYKEALKILADRYGIKTNYQQEKKEVKVSLTDITKYSMGFFKYYLNNSESGKQAYKYLESRGLSKQTIEKFNIGLSPNGVKILFNTLSDEKNFKDIDIINAGLARRLDKSGEITDIFTNRIMFPIINENGIVVGFSGRIYKDSNESKYSNSPENSLFKKGNVIYNLNNALDDVRKKKRIVIMEGFMDVISAYNAGLGEVVCLMGTALTENHIELIKKYTDNVVMCLDGDNAGKQNTLKAIQKLLNAKMKVQVACLPDNLDPDEFIKKYGKEQFLDIFEKELVDTYTFRYNIYKENENLENSVGIQNFQTEIFEMISKQNNGSLSEKYIKMLALDFNTSYESVNKDFEKYLAVKGLEKPKKVISTQTKVTIASLKAYETLIRYMLYGRNDFLRIMQNLEVINSLQDKYIEGDHPMDLMSLIYIKNKLDVNDKYFLTYIEFISKIEDFYKKNFVADIDKFLDSLSADLKEFYNDRIDKIKVTDEKKKDKEIQDCYNALTGFIIKCGIDRYTELIESNDTYDKTHYINQKVLLKIELANLKRG